MLMVNLRTPARLRVNRAELERAIGVAFLEGGIENIDWGSLTQWEVAHLRRTLEAANLMKQIPSAKEPNEED